MDDERQPLADQRLSRLQGCSDNRDMRHGLLRADPTTGFTLIEILIAMAIVTILLTIAVPSYQDSMRRSRRADAVAGLTQLQHLQERYRANYPTYADAAAIASLPSSAPTVSPEGHYALAVSAAASSTYTITATAQAGSPQFADARCRSLVIKMNNGGEIKQESTNAAGTVDTTNTNRCWQK